MLSSIFRNRSLAASVLLFILLGTVFFPSAGRDDDYIAFWSSYSILEFGELLNHNGERIEQGSSPGHILLLSAVSAISGLPAPNIAVPVAAICGVMLLLLMGRFRSAFDERTVALSMLLTASSYPFIYWSFSGLETTVYAFVLTLFCYFFLQLIVRAMRLRDYCYLYLLFLALQLLRPEAFFVLGLAAGLYWVPQVVSGLKTGKKGASPLAIAINLPATRFLSGVILSNIAAFATIICWRLLYFSSLFPQPVFAKIVGIYPGLHSSIPFQRSVAYVFDFFIQSPVFLAAILAGATIIGRFFSAGNAVKNLPALFLVAILLAQFTFILLAGPDWMEGFRFIAPITPILSVLVALFFAKAIEKNRRLTGLIVAGIIGAQAAGFGYFLVTGSSSIPLWATNNNVIQAVPNAQNYPWTARINTHHLRDIPLTEALNETVRKLIPVVGRPIVIASYQAGFVFYHAAKAHFGDIRFIDVAGLVDDTISRCRPLRDETRRLRDAASRNHELGHIEVLSYLIEKGDTTATCFTPRPDIIYLMGEVVRTAPHFQELGYELAFNNTGSIDLDFGNSSFYGGYLIDRDLFAKAELRFKQSKISVGY